MNEIFSFYTPAFRIVLTSQWVGERLAVTTNNVTAPISGFSSCNKILCLGHRRNLASASGSLIHSFLRELDFGVSQNRADRTKYSKCKEFISYYYKSKKKQLTLGH